MPERESSIKSLNNGNSTNRPMGVKIDLTPLALPVRHVRQGTSQAKGRQGQVRDTNIRRSQHPRPSPSTTTTSTPRPENKPFRDL